MSKIEWTDVTWNPTRGCSRVSPGCEHCYAERQAHRMNHPGGAYEGLTRMTARGPTWTGEVRLVSDQIDAPLRWKKPRMVFVDSMSDLFHEKVDTEFIRSVFEVMAACPQHTFQLLTKRPRQMQKVIDWIAVTFDGSVGTPRNRQTLERIPWPLPNVWLGVSCENQDAADARIPLLLDTPAAVRFVSAEPLLGPINFSGKPTTPKTQGAAANQDLGIRKLHWVIVGGESGPGARPCWVDSIRRIVDQCRAAGVATFVKQLGARPYQIGESPEPECNCREFDCEHRSQIPPVKWLKLKSRKGSDPAEWPADLRIQEMPK